MKEKMGEEEIRHSVLSAKMRPPTAKTATMGLSRAGDSGLSPSSRSPSAELQRSEDTAAETSGSVKNSGLWW